MKISLRIILINFVIVTLILGVAGVAFYTIMYNVLTSQQSKYLQKSSEDFVHAYWDLNQAIDNEFLLISKYPANINNYSLTSLDDVDFVFVGAATSDRIAVKAVKKGTINIPNGILTITKFLNENPSSIVKKYTDGSGVNYYYGKVLTQNNLDDISKTINAGIALMFEDTPVEISNEMDNQKNLYSLGEAYKNLHGGNNSDSYNGIYSNNDLISTLWKSESQDNINERIDFLIFNTISETAMLRSNIRNILFIIGAAGVLLALILTLIFTDKLRKQINYLGKGTEIIKMGDFKSRIEVSSKDEIGQLSGAFNSMLDVLERSERSKNDYSEFITLINKNPTLKEISDAALNKIILSHNFSTGALYILDNKNVRLVSSYGFEADHPFKKDSPYFNYAIENQQTVEIFSKEDLPVVSTGTLKLSLKNLLIIPIVYNSKTIALLELGSFDEPTPETKEYLGKIKEQLATGLTNATALLQLENLVDELKKLNDDYQQQNIQITKQNETLLELHNELKKQAEELEIQKQKAEESTRLKSQFLASMSHELRTPMNSILGLTELILDKASLDPKNRERLEVVLKSGKRLMNLINDILDLSKIEAGKMDIQEDELLLDELIDEVYNSITPLVLNKKIDFKIEKDTNTNIFITTDRGKVTQVLINLLGNSIKFTSEGYVKLRVYNEKNEFLKFDVIDTGIGISEENQKVIFEEFRQIDGSTTRKYSGTGLGLAICKRISEILQGSITLKSELGAGTTFTFTIPLRFVGSKAADEKSTVNVAKLIKNRRNPILVIDDDSEIRYTIGQYLNSRGYEVAYAEDGASGIEKAKKLQPFAITLDVMLPNRDGWSVLKDLKSDPATRDIPVILISIMGEKNVGYGLGAFEYFVKPISHDKLLSAFTKLENLAQKRIEKIVIVDDDELEFEKFKHAFGSSQVRIEYIRDSELAFSKILEVQPDLIILDLMMPKIDGITLSHKLKSNRETKHIPIIISTAKDLTDEEKSSLNNIVEQITVKSQGHPLDVLRVVRDRIIMQEDNSADVKNVIQNKKIPEKITDERMDYPPNEEISQGDVLIVDDDPDALFTLNEIVHECGCNTIMANGGSECLEILETKTPDLILLDIMMPGLDGFQVLKKIRQIKRLERVPVFAVTAKAMTGDKDIILNNGFDDYVPKPVNAGIIAFKIEKIFTKLRTI
jgi:signal transduction histidine kinase/CheY-like chemotaxis protein/HAMP domain-containing protein